VKTSGELQVLVASPTAAEHPTPTGQEVGGSHSQSGRCGEEEINFFSGIEPLHGQFSVAPQNKRTKCDNEKLPGSSQ
jgi:hypothetical protein